jgi:hypothetical protein
MSDEITKTMTLCPECGSLMNPVAVKTVKHLLEYELARALQHGEFWHCANPDCDVVYARFADSTSSDTPDEIYRRDDIKECAQPHAVGRERLVCYCFGYTAGEIEDDAASTANSVPAAITAEVRAGNCACEVKNPAGH